MKKTLYVLTSAALALSLAGCSAGADTTAGAAQATPTATPTATQTPSAVPAVDPLERLPEQPFGIDANAVAADPTAAGVAWQTGSDQADVPVTGAIQTFLQIIWAGSERQVLAGGPDVGKIQGSMKDLEHFVAPEVLQEARAAALPGLEFAKKVEAEGEDAEFEGDQTLWYPLHLATVAGPTRDDPARDEKRAAQWPDIKEGDPIGWAYMTDEQREIPFKTGVASELVPEITDVYDSPEDATSDVQIRANLVHDVPLMDGRTARITYPAWYRMTYQDGVWKALGWQYMVADATSVIKK